MDNIQLNEHLVECKMNTYIAYYRVSTLKQSKSGLGLASQKFQVNSYITKHDGELIEAYQDVESGSHNSRKGLNDAIQRATLTNSILIIAKLDRLGRNLAFLAKLLESNINFICCDNPNANKLTIHILAAIAEEERRLISQRTKDALLQAKLNGKKLGTNNLPKSDKESAQKAREGKSLIAREFNNEIIKLLDSIKLQSFVHQAKYLNRINIKTRQGHLWHPNTVRRLYKLDFK
jgi:DNA invertase Pin-like site-specific DNA recombinase